MSPNRCRFDDARMAIPAGKAPKSNGLTSRTRASVRTPACCHVQRAPLQAPHPQSKNELPRRTADNRLENKKISKINRRQGNASPDRVGTWHGHRRRQSSHHDKQVVECCREQAILVRYTRDDLNVGHYFLALPALADAERSAQQPIRPVAKVLQRAGSVSDGRTLENPSQKFCNEPEALATDEPWKIRRKSSATSRKR